MPFDTTHGERLTEERRRLGLSQIELSDACGITRTMLSRYERAAAEPGASSLIALSSAGVDLLFVITGKRAGESESTLAPAERDLLSVWRHADNKGRALLAAAVDVLKPE